MYPNRANMDHSLQTDISAILEHYDMVIRNGKSHIVLVLYWEIDFMDKLFYNAMWELRHHKSQSTPSILQKLVRAKHNENLHFVRGICRLAMNPSQTGNTMESVPMPCRH